jgi:hypothetical protein
MIQDTSLEALQKVRSKITKSQDAVLKIIRQHPEGLTNAEIGYYARKPINTITPRTNELAKMGLIYDAGRRDCRVTHSSAHAWKAKVPVLPPARDEKEEKVDQQATLL